MADSCLAVGITYLVLYTILIPCITGMNFKRLGGMKLSKVLCAIHVLCKFQTIFFHEHYL